MVLSENNNTSILSISICIAKRFPSKTDNTTLQPAHVTVKAILIATTVHYRFTYTFRCNRPSLSPLPRMHIFHILR